MRVFFAMLIAFLPVLATSQKLKRSNLKFGDVKASDFEPKFYNIDSAASAIVISDVGESSIVGNDDGFFSIEFKHHRKIRILDKNGFDNASVKMYLYSSGSTQEKIEDLEAVTYNVEGSTVVATKLEKSTIFSDRVDKRFVQMKFTFPNIREGSILEFRYKLVSPFLKYLRSWNFQGALPVLWSEYSVRIPSMFNYAVINQGYRQFDLTDATVTQGVQRILNPSNSATSGVQISVWEGSVYNSVWGIGNVPAMKTEPFTTSVGNYLQRIEFQLHTIRWPSGLVEDQMGTWDKLAEGLLKDEGFGADLAKQNGFLSGTVSTITAKAATDLEKAKAIYEYVRDNYTCEDHNAYYLSQSLKKVFQSRKGNVADINILLTAMLINKGFEAHPVLLSTTENGKANTLYPLLNRFNYVITELKFGNKSVLLDATRGKMGFGKLETDLYNGYGRLIRFPDPVVVPLSADSLVEARLTTLFITNNEDGKSMTGSFTSSPGYYESTLLRNRLSKQTEDEFFKALEKEYGFEIRIQDKRVDSLKNLDEPVTVRYDFYFEPVEEIIYLTPMFVEAQKENPFASVKRQYPVEMPYTFSETFVLNMEIPKGYKVDELPKSSRVRLNEDEGTFEYIISASATHIQFRSKVSVNRAIFSNEDYDSLRDFFGMIVKKHAEQIVLKKIR